MVLKLNSLGWVAFVGWHFENVKAQRLLEFTVQAPLGWILHTS
jgi:hypothetical protein